jgi:hypothetical protein
VRWQIPLCLDHALTTTHTAAAQHAFTIAATAYSPTAFAATPHNAAA